MPYSSTPSPITAAGGTVTGPILVPAGTAGAPAVAFSADADGTGTGIFRAAANVLSVANNGVETTRITATGQLNATSANVAGVLDFSTALAGAGDAGLARHAAGVVRVTPAGSTNIRGLLGGGTAIASAATLPAPTGSVCHVTGTTNVTGGITATNFQAGVQTVLIFDGALTLSNGGNLLLVGGTYTTTANDTLSLVYDGTSWFETGRSAL